MEHSEQSRREFLQTSAAGAAAAAVVGVGGVAHAADDSGGVTRRVLGRTGEKVSIVCLGGWHIGSVADKAEAVRIMHAAIDAGVNFFDNAWDYHDGGSEEIMGKALAEGGRRDKVFLMTKVCDRDYEGAKKHLDDSLRRMKTDRIDLWQFHEINCDNDPDWVFDKGGLRAALEAKKAGKVRHIGFTGHKDPAIHLKMLGKPFEWDTAQMPINVCDAHYRSFARNVLPECRKRNVGAIGMKSLGGGQLMKGDIPTNAGVSAVDCRRYSLSQDIASLVCGIDSMDVLKQDVGIARNFKPMTDAEQEAFRAKVAAVAGDGRYEKFKSSKFYDGPYHRVQHGFPAKLDG